MLLAIDTCGPYCSAAISGNGEIIALRNENIGRGHVERLMPMLEELLSESKNDWSELSKIACTIGPGSFTGLRVGLATARGLALALNCPCEGVSVFEAFAAEAKNNNREPFTVVMDAKREQVWLQSFDENSLQTGEPLALSTDTAHHHIPVGTNHLYGSGAPLVENNNACYIVKNNSASAPIEGVVKVALARKSGTHKPKPLYLRNPDAKPQNPPIQNPASLSG